MRKSKAKRKAKTDLEAMAALNFEGCDRQKFPVVPEVLFLEGMARMGRIAHVAHILAYLSKPQMVELMRTRKEDGEYEGLLSDFKEVTATMKELLQTIEKVEWRFLVAGCTMQHEDAA
jgi:hypothetical protein